MEKRRMHIGLALVMGWLSGNGWRKPDSQVNELFSLSPYLTLAQQAEQAKLDFVFRPDSLFLNTNALASEPGFSNLDPFILLSAIASQTQKIGLVSTASTSFLPPYSIARQLQSLHWLSQGRAGWNIVTGIEGHQNFGQQQALNSEQKYAKAAESLDVVQALWNSYPNDSLEQNSQHGRFANTDKIRPIQHKGPYFDVEGPLTTPQTPYGDIPLFQAGASDTGREFAARVALAVFAATPDIESGIELREDLRARAQRQGRDPDTIKVLPGLSLFLADTQDEAMALYQSTQSKAQQQRRFDYVKEAIGLDLTQFEASYRLSEKDLIKLTRPVRSLTHSQLMRRCIIRETPTVAEFLKRPEVCASSHWLIIGTPEEAVKEIIARLEAKAADGFIAIPGGSIRSANLLFEKVIPALSTLGWFRHEYQGQTLREHLQT